MFVYKIQNSITEKVYIGQSSQSSTHRLQEHVSKLRSNSHENRHLQRAWNKYGEEAFTIQLIDKGKTLSELNKLEEKYVKKYDSLNREHGYNIRGPGNNRKHSEETKKRISRSKKGIPVHTPESKEKIRKASMGRVHSEESKLKRSEKLKGIVWSKEVHDKWAMGHRKGQKYPSIISPTGKIYSDVVNMTEFCKKHGLQQQCMSRLVRNDIKSHHGWKINDEKK